MTDKFWLNVSSGWIRVVRDETRPVFFLKVIPTGNEGSEVEIDAQTMQKLALELDGQLHSFRNGAAYPVLLPFPLPPPREVFPLQAAEPQLTPFQVWWYRAPISPSLAFPLLLILMLCGFIAKAVTLLLLVRWFAPNFPMTMLMSFGLILGCFLVSENTDTAVDDAGQPKILTRADVFLMVGKYLLRPAVITAFAAAIHFGIR